MFLTNKDDCPVCCLLNRLLLATRKYTILDFAIFKTCLFSAGALIGVLIAKLKGNLKSIVLFMLTATFIFSWIYVFFRTFLHMSEDK